MEMVDGGTKSRVAFILLDWNIQIISLFNRYTPCSSAIEDVKNLAPKIERKKPCLQSISGV